MSSSVIPGNEQPVQRLKDNLSRQGAHLIHYKTSDVHSSGHANADELLWIHERINPKFFIPVHGYHYMLTVHADIEMIRGTKRKDIIVPDNGMIIEIQNAGEKIVTLEMKAPSDLMVVDGNQVGKVEQVVLNDRQKLGEDGIFAIIAVIDTHSHRLKKSPDIASRGFVYLRESQDMLHEVRYMIKQSIDEYLSRNNSIDKNVLKEMINGMVEKELYERTSKRPVVSTVIITI
jgi:ribonuclease J